MNSLEISINNTLDDPRQIQMLAEEFERQHQVKIDLQIFNWMEAWNEFMKISLYRHGPVISETGDTWMGSLIGRNCLRPFKNHEVQKLGGPRAFLTEMWQSSLDPDGGNVMAIPWLLDTYLVYYRRDLLENAGVDPASAFATPGNFVQALEKLTRAGVQIPLAIPTSGNSLSITHNASSWVWEAGGDFISADGRRVLFSHPHTLSGLRNYFGLHRFMPPAARSLEESSSQEAFFNGNAAITLFYPPALYDLKHGRYSKQLAELVGVAAQPGIPFVGGSNLIIWNHIPPGQEEMALELVNLLTSEETLTLLFQKTGIIPARLDVLRQIESDPDYAPVVQSFRNGKAYKSTRLWGLVEDKLTKALSTIWQKIFSTADADIDQIIAETLAPLEERLNITLSQ
jgi:multiple sugar transport system substrate-binding protein